MDFIFKSYNSWTWQRISRHVIYWMTWSIFYVLLNYFTTDGQPLSDWIFFEALVLPIKITCSYTIVYGLMPRYLWQGKRIEFMVSAIGVALVCGAALFSVYRWIVFPYLLDKHSDHTDPGMLIYKATELFYITGMVVSVKFFQYLLNEKEKIRTLEQQKKEAELKYLKNQVQPHFLFNTLNNIYGLILSNDSKAAESVVMLSETLSYMLYDCDVKRIPLAIELENLNRYIELEKLRYGNRLCLTYTADQVPEDLLVAPLLLFPLVENAFKHGPAKLNEGAKICISLVYTHDALTFRVKNNFKEADPNPQIKSGIGLTNIRKRLALIYPDSHEFEVSEKPPVYNVKLTLTHLLT